MIVPMKKIWIAATATSKNRVLHEVAKLGVVHIQTQNRSAQGLEAVKEELNKTELALGVLEEYAPKKPGAMSRFTLEEVNQVLQLQHELNQAQQMQLQAEKALDEINFWGDWEPEVAQVLEKNGYHPLVYRLKNQKNLVLPPRSVIWKKQGDLLYVLVLQEQAQPLGDYEVIPFPKQGRRALLSQKAQAEEAQQRCLHQLKDLAQRLEGLRHLYRRKLWEVDWESSLAAIEQHDEVVFWTGFIPVREWPALREAAQRGGYGVAAVEPTPDDAVPTLVQNPIVPGMVKPVFDLLGTIPGYWERDISLPFLLYFLVFFSIIIGDAGYGLIFLLGGLGLIVSDLRHKKRIGEGGLLLTVLSVATVVWGSLTGTWFGNLIDLADGGLRDFLRSLTRQPFVNPDYSTNQAFVKFFCFTLGLTQLALGHVWNFFRLLVRDRNPLKSLAELGALTSTLALYPLVLSLVLPAAEVAQLPRALVDFNRGTPWALWPEDVLLNLFVAAGGVGIVILFGRQEGNFLKGIKDGFSNILNIALGSVGWFSDNISYIRLFAVGLAGFAIAQSFNTMALGALQGLQTAGQVGQILGISVALLILLLGHGLNLIMALLGVIVHGVRLNLLEFSGRLGIEWSGFAFKPLQVWQDKN